MDADIRKEEPESKKFSLLDESKKLSESHFHDPSFVTRYGRLETNRSERYGISYSIIVIHVESFNHGKTVPGKKELLDFLRKLVSTVLKVIRNCDVAGMLEDKRVIALLPHTDYFGSLIVIKKLSKALEFLTIGGEPYASIIFSQATYPKDANGFGELVGTAARRVTERLSSPWEKFDLKGKLFWEIVAALTGASYNLPEYSTFDTGPELELENSFIHAVNETIAREIARAPEKRGILYIGTKRLSGAVPFKKELSSLGKTSTKIFLVGAAGGGGEGQEGLDIRNVTTIHLTDHRIEGVYFTFFMNEDSSYALVARESWGDTHNCFHTSDPYVVEGIITKLQRDYSLQEQL
ncbi:MAG: hypothetical protein HY883_03370 [Deltaproteobacteria bacterium]|nr:hypothetical protein [Deltaproteobacteria bacterium]